MPIAHDHDHDQGQTGRVRRSVAVELRPAAEPPSDEELRQRERKLERLIIKAACRRATGLAEQAGTDRDVRRPPAGRGG